MSANDLSLTRKREPRNLKFLLWCHLAEAAQTFDLFHAVVPRVHAVTARWRQGQGPDCHSSPLHVSFHIRSDLKVVIHPSIGLKA